MGTVIDITAGGTTLTITGDGVYSGCTYDRFDGWYGIDDVDLEMIKRPNAPGAFAPAQTFPGAASVSIEGDYFGSSRRDALLMRENLAALYNEGRIVRVSVADDLRTTYRDMLVAAVKFPWTIHPEFSFTIDLKAEDPRRYAAELAQTTTLAAPGPGLPYPIEYPVDYGPVGVNGRIVIPNPGNTGTVTRFVVSDGEMPDGFEVVNVTTGERLVYLGPLVAGTTVTLDGMTRTAFINGTGPGGRFLASPQWWTVPPRSSVEVQFLARGNVAGTPRLYAFTPPAFY